MKAHPAGLLIAGLTAGFLANTASAHHNVDNTVVLGGTLSLSGRYARPAGRYSNAARLYVSQLNERAGSWAIRSFMPPVAMPRCRSSRRP